MIVHTAIQNKNKPIEAHFEVDGVRGVTRYNSIKGLRTAVKNMKPNEVFLWAIDSKGWDVIRPHQL